MTSTCNSRNEICLIDYIELNKNANFSLAIFLFRNSVIKLEFSYIFCDTYFRFCYLNYGAEIWKI